jgi:hypothetical protein
LSLVSEAFTYTSSCGKRAAEGSKVLASIATHKNSPIVQALNDYIWHEGRHGHISDAAQLEIDGKPIPDRISTYSSSERRRARARRDSAASDEVFSKIKVSNVIRACRAMANEEKEKEADVIL